MSKSRSSPTVLVVALIIGCAIGYMDSRPTWDDTGITAGATVLSAAALTFGAPGRALFVALLLGFPVVVMNYVTSRRLDSWIVLVIALVGAGIGFALRRFSVPRHTS
jgi:hypothetical protein